MKDLKLTKKELELLREVLGHCEEHQRWLISDDESFNLEEFESLQKKVINSLKE